MPTHLAAGFVGRRWPGRGALARGEASVRGEGRAWRAGAAAPRADTATRQCMPLQLGLICHCN
eukprot:6207795-Pleurochrysis_carterae.AAC.2